MARDQFPRIKSITLIAFAFGCGNQYRSTNTNDWLVAAVCRNKMHRRYVRMLDVKQPKPEALRYLARLPDDVMMNLVEIAHDQVLRDPISAVTLAHRFRHSFLQPWHGARRGVIAYPLGFSTRVLPKKGEKRAGFWFNYYGSKPSRMTGHPYCFHFEGKHEGRQFVKRLGLHSFTCSFHPCFV
jgi:hypothetical protein